MGRTDPNNHTASDLWLVKTDSDGNMIWSKTFGGLHDDEGHCIQETINGNLVIVGYTRSYGEGNWDVWLIKIDREGDEIWSKTFGGESADYGGFVQATSDGGYIITGNTSSYGNGYSDTWLIKTDSDGNEAWGKLQWGRVVGDAEIFHLGQRYGIIARLQWGRVVGDAEMREVCG